MRKYPILLQEHYTKQDILEMIDDSNVLIDEDIKDYWFSGGDKEILFRNNPACYIEAVRQQQGTEAENLMMFILKKVHSFRCIRTPYCGDSHLSAHWRNKVKCIGAPCLDLIGYPSREHKYFTESLYEIEIKSKSTKTNKLGDGPHFTSVERQYINNHANKKRILIVQMKFERDGCTIRYLSVM